MVLNSLNFCLSEKLFISPSVLNEILAGYSSLGCRLFPFSALCISCHSLLACRLSAERSVVKHMGFPLYVTCCFSLAAFNILCVQSLLVWLVCVLVCFSLGLSCIGFFVPLGFDYFLFHVGEIFNYNLYKHFLILFLFLFFFWDPYNSNVGVFDMVPEVSETVLSSCHYFTLFCSSEVIFTILSSSSLIHSSA